MLTVYPAGHKGCLWIRLTIYSTAVADATEVMCATDYKAEGPRNGEEIHKMENSKETSQKARLEHRYMLWWMSLLLLGFQEGSYVCTVKPLHDEGHSRRRQTSL